MLRYESVECLFVVHFMQSAARIILSEEETLNSNHHSAKREAEDEPGVKATKQKEPLESDHLPARATRYSFRLSPAALAAAFSFFLSR